MQQNDERHGADFAAQVDHPTLRQGIESIDATLGEGGTGTETGTEGEHKAEQKHDASLCRQDAYA
jgi:hypothetical protein